MFRAEARTRIKRIRLRLNPLLVLLNMTNVTYKHSRHTERWRKYPVTSLKELLCKKDNYIEINNKLDCFGSKEPHNDVFCHTERHRINATIAE